MNLYMIKKDDNEVSYDTYKGCIVVAESADEAFYIACAELSNFICGRYSTKKLNQNFFEITEIGKAKNDLFKGVIFTDYLEG